MMIIKLPFYYLKIPFPQPQFKKFKLNIEDTDETTENISLSSLRFGIKCLVKSKSFFSSFNVIPNINDSEIQGIIEKNLISEIPQKSQMVCFLYAGNDPVIKTPTLNDKQLSEIEKLIKEFNTLFTLKKNH